MPPFLVPLLLGSYTCNLLIPSPAVFSSIRMPPSTAESYIHTMLVGILSNRNRRAALSFCGGFGPATSRNRECAHPMDR